MMNESQLDDESQLAGLVGARAGGPSPHESQLDDDDDDDDDESQLAGLVGARAGGPSPPWRGARNPGVRRPADHTSAP